MSSDVPLVSRPQAGGEFPLPQDGSENVLITSALPYVNNVPHLGNIIGSVLSADVFARYNRNRNRPTLYICGTDEYGTATETKALEDGVSPKELCDKYHEIHKEVYKWFEIGFDHFGRTTTEEQTQICQEMFLNLLSKEVLEEQAMDQLYCEKHKSFLADRFVEGTCPKCGFEDARGDQCDKCGSLLDSFDLINPRCKLDGTKPIGRTSKHMFLKLDSLQPKLQSWIEESSRQGKWSANGRIITEGWLREGLKPRCITRDLSWGVKVPLEGMKEKVLYVWFDAPNGYLSITATYSKDWEKWWKRPKDVKLYQFMGKDNVPFHTVIWPSMLLGTEENWTLLHHISTTEYLQYENGKFSKSRNVGVFGNSAKDTAVSPSVWRYYLLANRPETSDTQFNWGAFILRNNSELLANLGNFVNRALKFAEKNYNQSVPDPEAGPSVDQVNLNIEAELDKNLVNDVNSLFQEYITALENVHLREGIRIALQVSARGNLYLQENRLDNKLLTDRPRRCATVVMNAINLTYKLSTLIEPYMPSTSDSISQQLNAQRRTVPERLGDPETGQVDRDLRPGHKLGKTAYLFKMIDPAKETEWRARYGGDETKATDAAADKPKTASQQARAKKKERKAKEAAEIAQQKGQTADQKSADEGKIADALAKTALD